MTQQNSGSALIGLGSIGDVVAVAESTAGVEVLLLELIHDDEEPSIPPSMVESDKKAEALKARFGRALYASYLVTPTSITHHIGHQDYSIELCRRNSELMTAHRTV